VKRDQLHLLDGPLNGQQRRSLHLIARELLRRAQA